MRDARPADPRGEHREAARARARAARARVARLRGDRAHPARAAVLRSARPRLGKWGARKRPRVSVEHGGPGNGPASLLNMGGPETAPNPPNRLPYRAGSS